MGYVRVPEIKKLYKGRADVREHYVKEAKREGKGLILTYNGKTMVIEKEKVSRGHKYPYPIKSKYEGYYFLIGYVWEGEEGKDALQTSLDGF